MHERIFLRGINMAARTGVGVQAERLIFVNVGLILNRGGKVGNREEIWAVPACRLGSRELRPVCGARLLNGLAPPVEPNWIAAPPDAVLSVNVATAPVTEPFSASAEINGVAA
jgi:hypothetical protein